MRPIMELTSRYRLESLIAAGGMGEVWRADDQILDRHVAVKLLRPEYGHDPVILARFRAEARYEGQLSHPGIAQVYDYAEADPASPAYLVMELVDGPSLAALLAAGPLPPLRTADVLAQAAQALHAAHVSGVVHRDIKPGNLLIAADGQVKVTDFGIAVSPQAASLTNTGALLGTMAYLAPERASGQSATPASDLYALGVVGYECLTGQPPFQGEPLQVALAHRDQPFPELPDWCLGSPVAVALARLILDMTAKDPALRPGSAAEVAARAGEIRDGVRPQARLVPAPPTQGDAPAGGGLPGARVPGRGLSGVPSGMSARDRGLRHHGLAAGILVAVVLVAAVVAWQLTGLSMPRSAAAPAASSPALRPAVARMVRVTTALVGLPVSVARQRLHARGLRVKVQAWPDRNAAPGTVLQVTPTGRLAMGHLVLLTVAARPAPAPSAGRAPSGPGRPTPSGAPSRGSVPPGRAKHTKGPPPGHGGGPG